MLASLLYRASWNQIRLPPGLIPISPRAPECLAWSTWVSASTRMAKLLPGSSGTGRMRHRRTPVGDDHRLDVSHYPSENLPNEALDEQVLAQLGHPRQVPPKGVPADRQGSASLGTLAESTAKGWK